MRALKKNFKNQIKFLEMYIYNFNCRKIYNTMGEQIGNYFTI